MLKRNVVRFVGIAGFVGVLGAAPAPLRGDELPAVPLAWDDAALDRMVRAIADHQRVADGGGWPAVPEGPSMRPGESHGARVAALRRRLAASGDMPADAAGSASEAVEASDAAAVARFQARHGLVADGIAGRKTVETMNLPAADRVAQLMLNYDRLRLLARGLPTTAVVVNIPAATVQLVTDGRTALVSRAIVGQRGWPTPLLEGTIGEIELNPFWNVPARIARRELLPRIAAEPSYLAANHMRVLGGPGGEGETPAAQVDWPRFLDLGYRLRQDPGPDNPLGAVKFVFPNRYDVYLHDTPSKQLFARDERALSHGCVRVERAFDLALRLLAGDPAWSAESLRAAIDSGRTRRVPLARSMAVRTVYVTAWVAADGAVQFRRDPYGRDAAESAGRAPRVEAVAGCGPGDAALPG